VEKIIAEYTELVKAYCSCPSDATIEAIEAFEEAHPELHEMTFGTVFMNVSGGKFD
jgi:hypothetical protein